MCNTALFRDLSSLEHDSTQSVACRPSEGSPRNPLSHHFGTDPALESRWTQMAQGDSSAERSYPACPKAVSWRWNSLTVIGPKGKPADLRQIL